MLYSGSRLLKSWGNYGKEAGTESRISAKTDGFLGANYEVMASQGHVRDLPKSQLGIDVEHYYEPKYITIRGKGDLLASLRKEVKKAEKIYLATDPDREGEAISWHLYYALKLEDKKVYRITFNEITKSAVKESLKHAREIDMNLVDAQQARRVLDRVVGYRISPILWAKIKRGLSAGRVQSVALRIICDREDEINAFIPEEYWSLDVNLKVKGEKKPICAKYYGTTEKKQGIGSKEEADEIMNSLYYIHLTAGSQQGTEFLHTKDHASGTAVIRRCGYQGRRYGRSDHLFTYRFHPCIGRSGSAGCAVHRCTLR